jgi:hypothetical protein
MNKKKVNILLIPFASIVWIIVLLRIFSITKQPADLINSKQEAVVSDSNYISSDTLTLLLNYRDPFDQSINLLKVNNDQSIKETQVPILKEIIPPNITYFGLIDQNKERADIGLTIVNQHSFLLNEGDTLLGLRVKQLYQDSIIVVFQDKTMRVKKTQQSKL